MFKIINKKLDLVFENDPDPLNKVRARFLVNTLLFSLTIIALTLPSFYFNFPSLFIFFRTIGLALLQLTLLWFLLNTSKWRMIAHLICIMVGSLIWSNIYIIAPGIKIITLQWTLLIVVMSYYLLGTKWGVFYSALSLLFMLFYFQILGNNITEDLRPIDSNRYTFAIIFSFNFLLIMYGQYHFFNAFNLTIDRLSEKQIAEKLLNEKLSKALIDAEQSTLAKTYFLSTISHELRTPLNGVIGMTDVLLLDNPREDQSENLNMLKFSANNLLTLINAVLDINKIEAGKIIMEKMPFRIDLLVKNIYNSFKIKASDKNLDFVIDVDKDLEQVVIIGDPTRLTQILINLIENALKFTSAGQVSILVKTVEKQNNTIRLNFCVSDTGIGIPLDKQDIIFESFSQASSSTTREYGGTGLGLAIVKNLLELHNSTIVIQSQENAGTAFSFEITYELSDTLIEKNVISRPASQNEADISHLSILVAEDNQMNTLLMKKLLARWQIIPDFAINGLEALNAFKNKTYDLILMDIHMPVMDGYEAALAIRNDHNQLKSQIPIIAVTASVSLDVRGKVTEAGMNDFVSKPFKPEDLRAKLEDIAVLKRG